MKLAGLFVKGTESMKNRSMAITILVLVVASGLAGCGIQNVSLDDYIYIGFRAPTKIHVYSPKAEDNLIKTLTPAENLRAMVLSPDKTVLYVSHDNGYISAISIYDLHQPNWTHKFEDVQVLGDITVSADGKYLAVLQGDLEDRNSQDVVIFEVIPDSNNPENPPTIKMEDKLDENGQPLEVYDLKEFSAFSIVPYKTVHVGGDLYMIEGNPVKNHAYVFDSHKKKVKVIDLEAGTVLRTIAYPGSVKRFAVSNDGRTGYAVINSQSSVYRIDLDRMTIGRSFYIPGGPTDCIFSRDDRYLFVGSKFGQCIFILDLNSIRDQRSTAQTVDAMLNRLQKLSFEKRGILGEDLKHPREPTPEEAERLEDLNVELKELKEELAALDQGVNMTRITNMTGPDRLVLSNDGKYMYILFDDNRIRTMKIDNIDEMMNPEEDSQLTAELTAEVKVDSTPLDFIVSPYFNTRRASRITE
jgi:6-phosphogluconolactonase (cycloisomerase 2 family)